MNYLDLQQNWKLVYYHKQYGYLIIHAYVYENIDDTRNSVNNEKE